MKTYLAFDVGGSSIKTALITADGQFISEIKRFPAKSDQTTDQIIDNFLHIICTMADSATQTGHAFNGIGIGFPGPFDYQKGISLMKGLNKYDSIYGVPLKDILLSKLPFSTQIHFANDADLYCMGECTFGVGRPFHRILAVCIGTGIGSGFFADGKLVKEGLEVPENGWIYKTPYRDSIVDNYISATGIRRMIHQNPYLANILDVKELADTAQLGNPYALSLFQEFGTMLTEILPTFIQQFHAEALIIGGDVAKSFPLFSSPIKDLLASSGVSVLPSKIFSDNSLLAASILFE